MAREDLHFRLRIPEELKNKVAEAAESNGTSMTAEIVSRVERSFLNWPTLDLPPEQLSKVVRMPEGSKKSLKWEIETAARKLIEARIVEHETSRRSLLQVMTDALESEPEEVRPEIQKHMEKVLVRMGLGPLNVEDKDLSS